MKKVVTVGGGTGSYTVLKGLKEYSDIELSAIVSMADDGGSTGVLRDELGVLPPGDVRQCLVALSHHSDVIRNLMSYRFEEGKLSGHSFGNIFLAALEKVAGSFAEGVEIASEILKIRGRVIPVTENCAHLKIILENGEELDGESTINHSNLQNVGVRDVTFRETVHINKHAEDALLSADLIIIGPGNFYCSIVPNLVVSQFKETLQKTKAKIVIPVNLTNKKGHTLFFTAQMYVEAIEKTIGRKVDYILMNNELPTQEQIDVYKLTEGDGVIVEDDMTKDTRVIHAPLLSHTLYAYTSVDTISQTRSFIRHDSEKIAKALHALAYKDGE